MMARQTALRVRPIDGDKLYQKRGRAAFPLLVRQAEAGQPITYTALSQELAMPNPRNLNDVLGSVGQTIEGLSKQWKSTIPPLQSLVVSKNSGVPGTGVGWFLRKEGDFAKADRAGKRRIIAAAHSQIYAYPYWRDALEEVGLQPAHQTYQQEIRRAAQLPDGRGGGESARHRAMKAFVSANPSCIDLPARIEHGTLEEDLPSGDRLDVSFRYRDRWVAAEVKTTLSAEADLVRGLFQCVKYRAVMEAVLRSEGDSGAVAAVLALEGRLPASLIALRNILGVPVCEDISGF